MGHKPGSRWFCPLVKGRVQVNSISYIAVITREHNDMSTGTIDEEQPNGSVVAPSYMSAYAILASRHPLQAAAIRDGTELPPKLVLVLCQSGAIPETLS